MGCLLHRLLVTGILLACGLGCQPRPLSDGLPAEINCSSCHGSPNNSAPPRAVNSATSTTDIGVGAHQAHINPGPDPIAGPVACTECHVVPAALNYDEHPSPIPGPAIMSFGPLARTGGANPAWDRTSATCANTYCHGSTLEGSTTAAPPNWTTVDGSQIMCSSCHGDWPELLGASHPFHIAYTCDTCHARVVVAGMMTIRNPDLHIDGKVDVSMAVGTWDPVSKSCADMPSACHSSGSIPW